MLPVMESEGVGMESQPPAEEDEEEESKENFEDFNEQLSFKLVGLLLLLPLVPPEGGRGELILEGERGSLV